MKYLLPRTSDLLDLNVSYSLLFSNQFSCKISTNTVDSAGFPQALEIMENLENHKKKFHAWKFHGMWKTPE